jgi:hypothetical protein
MRFLTCFAFATIASSVGADPLSKSLEIDFFREAPARNLSGLAVRSDGRVLNGPTQAEVPLKLPADLLWTLRPALEPDAWLIGTGPEGKVLRVTLPASADPTVETLVDLEATHVFSLLPLDRETFLAGTSPQGTLALVRRGKVVASASLPADSILDLARFADGQVLVATGNPGRIYRLDLTTFEQAGELKAKPTVDELPRIGVTLFGEIRDRNVRRILPLADGRVIAGSAPKGNVYAFPAQGGAPLLLLENREAEVTDLLAHGDRAFFAALTLSGGTGESRLNRPTPAIAPSPAAAAEAVEPESKPDRFTGRGQLVHFPAEGLPEVVISRANVAFYRLAWHNSSTGPWVVIAGGEQGELLAYAPAERRSLNLGATGSAQVNSLAPLKADAPGRFLLLRNNPAGLSRFDFSEAKTGTLETRKLDLGVASALGQVRFAQVRGPESALELAVRTSFGSDELEGWSAWKTLTATEGGWFSPGLQGRYVQLRISTRDPALQFDKATLFHLPQNRRPLLGDFRIFPANLGIVPAGDTAPATVTTTLGQMLAPAARDAKDDAAKRKGGLMNSPIVSTPGAQIVYWSLTDPDDDNLTATFSISPENSSEWIDLAIQTRDPFVQFEISHLPEGRYLSRLVVNEQAPRPAPQRLSHTFETDVLTIDRTAPEIVRTGVIRITGGWRIEVEGFDSLSLLEGAEFILNNGTRLALEQPADGILDGRRETFVAEFTDAEATPANSVEIVLYDKSGNTASRRLSLK